ncbi:dehydrodolichyl diphosphate synthase complex subunit DHDDS [Hylaeus anthracinus]|uniref:dehydrodolichyl diphosphate synthase complex subunit DHDDS n=1 Tax=Hylaeus volcanicus TaxID=313075 RepID=UPI0023B77680|nr:dehydrodolichyl diphosphate synthase complex subunit DHDDS [Hylaeus volcanicus]XP_054006793.1 dehydrodolichyl diphosphate synthase complex subunit DHDDS [Hylaeus anthracinus]
MSWIRDSTLSWLQLLATKVIKTGHIPKHVAFIMDGNRRYATKNGIEKIEGHTKGFDKFAETLQWCRDVGIKEVTFYAFSIENFKRKDEEVNGLLNLAEQKFRRLLGEKDKAKEYGLCVRIIGNLSLLPQNIQELIAETMICTKDHTKVFLNIAFAYTSRDEITHAIKDVIEGVQGGDILLDDIDENLISNCLYTNNSPNPDLLIRTSGEVRFSDFLMWQISNTCVYFTTVLWPEFNVWDFLNAIFYYQRCYSDIQKIIKIQNVKPIIQNSRQLTYIDKLHHKRQIALERIYPGNI